MCDIPLGIPFGLDESIDWIDGIDDDDDENGSQGFNEPIESDPDITND